MQRLKVFYRDIVVPKLLDKFGYKSSISVPKLKKIVINRGFDESCQVSKVLDSLVSELTFVAGQRFYLTRSKKAISNFKLKEDVSIGMSVTLRGEKMYSFLDRLINLALPRIRDFQGVSLSGFDTYGNFSLGLVDQSLFPEVDFDKIIKFKGLDIVIVIESNSLEESVVLLRQLGMPFK